MTDTSASAPPAPVSARRQAWTAPALALGLLAVNGVVAAESFRGLVGFGGMIGIHGLAALGVPLTLDGVGIIAALVALRAELAREPSGVYRLTLYVFTLASGAANWYHGVRAGGAPAALYLAGMSLAVAWVFTLTLRNIRHAERVAARTVLDPLPRFGLASWLRYPGLTFRALSLSIKDGHTTPREALTAAALAIQARALPVLDLDAETLAAMPGQARLAAAFGALGRVDVPAAVALLAERGAPIDQSHAYQLRRALLEGQADAPALPAAASRARANGRTHAN